MSDTVDSAGAEDVLVIPGLLVMAVRRAWICRHPPKWLPVEGMDRVDAYPWTDEVRGIGEPLWVQICTEWADRVAMKALGRRLAVGESMRIEMVVRVPAGVKGGVCDADAGDSDCDSGAGDPDAGLCG